MKCVKFENVLLCHIECREELDNILKKETPEFVCDLIERHREDHIKFDGEGFYVVNYQINNPCDNGFWVEKQDKDEVLKLFILICG